MGAYLVKFTPLEPYFFGNERNFGYGLAKNKTYFIESNELPSQSTLFGTLRYCCIEDPGKSYNINPEEIGAESFNLLSEKIQSFGKIKRMSPIFLAKGDVFYIPVPMNHKKAVYYTPFSQYEECLTEKGIRSFPVDYDTKVGLQDGFMQINGEQQGKVFINYSSESLLFKADRIGINTRNRQQGFFRKVYCMLAQGCSFAVLADIDKQVPDQMVYMGRDKSPFKVSFIDTESVFGAGKDKYGDAFSAMSKMIKDCIKKFNNSKKFQLALSDLYIPNNVEAIYNGCSFSCIKTKDYRSFTTNYKTTRFENRFQRGSTLQTMIKAGSIFVLKDETASVLSPWKDSTVVRNAQQIGYNIVIECD